jgi:hypothetical protein
MFKYFLFVCAIVLLIVPSWAQLYEGKQDEMVAPMDRAINQANEMYADFPFPGDKEDAIPQEVRYQEMTEPVNGANERHFEEGRHAQTIVEREEK